MDDCLTDETMAAIADGTLRADARQSAIGHLDHCVDCRRVLGHVLSADAPQGSELVSREALTAGATIDRYVVQDCIGAGSMGVVYTAHDPALGRRVALKVLRGDPSNASSQGARRRLLREAQAMARLSHPNVVAIYDVGLHGEEVFLAMELIPGGTLREWLHRSRRSWRDIVGAFRRAGDGLAAAHAVGLVHRDFKPDNVLVGNDGRVCVTDFGLARPSELPAPRESLRIPAHAMESMTHTGTVVGTPAYMSPEQIEGSTADARSDLFSYSVALYEALYGERPFAASSIIELGEVIARGEIRPPPPRTHVPSWLRRVVVRGLRAAPAERPASMAALCESVDRGLARRRRLTIAALVAGALAIVVALVFARPSDGGATTEALAHMVQTTPVTELPLPTSSSAPALAAYRHGLTGIRNGIRPGYDFARAAELDPQLAEAHLRYAIEEFWAVPVEAREHLARAAELRSKLTVRDQRVLEAAQAWMQNQPADRAAYARLLVKANGEFPLDAEIAFRAGEALLETGERDRALTLFDRALELDPAFGAAYRQKADILAYEGKLDQALAAIERCTERAPDATNCIGQRMLLDGLEGNCRRVEQDARRMLARDPSSDAAYYWLASAGYSEGRSLEAVRELLRERAARLPDAMRSRYESWHQWSLAVLTGDFDAARDQARELERTTAPDADRRMHARAAYWWASASIESGRPADAATGARDFLLRKDAWLAEPRGEDFSLLRDLTPRLLIAERHGGLLTPAAFEAERTKWIELWEAQVNPNARPFVWLHGYAAIVETRADAERALAEAPRFGIPLYTPFTLGDAFIGTTYYLAGQTADALPFLQRAARSCIALEVPFEHTQVQLLLGDALGALGRRDEACAAYAVVITRWGHARPRSITADKARAAATKLACPAPAR